jgi:hypothetical protein
MLPYHPAMRTGRLLLPAVAAALALLGGACGGGDSSPALTTAHAGGAQACSDYTPGKDGIIQVFCDGSATAGLTIGSASTKLTGGSCTDSNGYYAINFGAVAGPDFTGDKPDYIGALFPEGTTTAQAVTVRAGGQGGTLTKLSSTVSDDQKSVHIEGTTTAGDKVTADIAC